MAEPELLVDLRHQPVDLVEAVVGHLGVEGAGDVQGLEVVAPVERGVVIGPLPRHRHCQLIGAGALARPVVARGNVLHEIDGIAVTGMTDLGECHRVPRCYRHAMAARGASCSPGSRTSCSAAIAFRSRKPSRPCVARRWTYCPRPKWPRGGIALRTAKPGEDPRTACA